MGAADPENAKGLSPRQAKWFATARASLEKDTGKSLDEWVAIARTCPEAKPRARIAWMKQRHGLGMNRASIVMSAAFPTGSGWDEPVKLREALWQDPAAAAILEAVERVATALPDVVTGQRKAFTGFSRNFQFAAARPLKGGQTAVGLALDPAVSPRLSPAARDGWSERLTARIVLADPVGIDADFADLLRQAWARS